MQGVPRRELLPFSESAKVPQIRERDMDDRGVYSKVIILFISLGVRVVMGGEQRRERLLLVDSADRLRE